MENIIRIIVVLTVMSVSAVSSVAEPPGDDSGQAAVMYERGNAYFMIEEYPDALECYLEGLRLAEDAHDYKTAISCLGNIGLIFSFVNDYERGAYYTRKTFEMASQHGLDDIRRRSACLLTELYVNLNRIDSAEYYNHIQKSIVAGDNAENNYLSFYNDGLISEAKGNRSLAVFYYNRALDYARSHDFPIKYEIQQLTEIGKVYMDADSIDTALEYLHQAERIADSIRSPNMLIGIYRLMEKSYALSSDTVSANIYKARYASVSDTIIDRIRFNAAKNSLYEYEEEQNGLRISGLRDRLDTYMVTIGSILAILMMLVLFTVITVRNNRRLQRVQRILIDKNRELTQQSEKNNELRDRYLDAMQQIEESPDKTRYKAGIPERQLEIMIKKITTVMEDTEAISNPQFNLNTLVGLVDSNSTYVSWIINETYGKNFKTLLNEYRIKEAAKRLCDTENYGNMTIQSIYESVGYNSASNFIKAFRTVMGMTPSAYQKLQRGSALEE